MFGIKVEQVPGDVELISEFCKAPRSAPAFGAGSSLQRALASSKYGDEQLSGIQGGTYPAGWYFRIGEQEAAGKHAAA